MAERRIEIIIDTTRARRNTGELDQSIRNVGDRANQSMGAFNKLSAAIGGVFAGVAMGQVIGALAKAQREFDKLNAQLVTATGSLQGATDAFAAIEKLAADTPFSVQGVTEAFVKLKNLGLDPSEEAIISYGNTAAAMGKDLMEFIEAVADATTSEFERLKEFGIRAKQEGDKVSLTFQGVTKTIGNNAAEIEGYLRNLGDNEFGGALEARVNTFDGQISQLSDSWERLVRTVAGPELSGAMGKVVVQVTDALDELSSALASGQLGAVFDGFLIGFEGYSRDFAVLGSEILKLFNILSSEIGDEANSITGFLSGAFTNIIPNIRAFYQIMTVEVIGTLQKVASYANFVKTAFTEMSLDGATLELEANLTAINSVRLDSIDAILLENTTAKSAMQEQIGKAKELRLEYERTKNAGGGLGQFKSKTEAAADPVEDFAADPQDPFAASSDNDGSAALASLQAETQAMRAEFETRKALKAEHQAALNAAGQNGFAVELANLNAFYAEKAAAEQLAHEADLAVIAERKVLAAKDEQLTVAEKMAAIESLNMQKETLEKQHQETLGQITMEGEKERREIEEAQKRQRIANLQSMGATLMSLTQGQSKKAFQASKALSLGIAAASLPGAIIESYKNAGGYPTGIPAAAAMALAGAKEISAIKNAKFGGGGSSGGGSVGGGGGGGGGMAAPSIPSTASDITAQVQARPQKTLELRVTSGFRTADEQRNMIMEVANALASEDGALNVVSSAQVDLNRRSAS